MIKNPPEGMPRLIPYIYYQDVDKAFDWLSNVFGFEKRGIVFDMGNGQKHAELTYKESVFMLGTVCDKGQGASPIDTGGVCTQHLYIYVDNVDEHYQAVKPKSKKEVKAPEDMFWGDRIYVVGDCEGHIWTFAQHVKDIAPEDMKP
jgi:uncharacterized glyoxalase superfamily protein PhnB